MTAIRPGQQLLTEFRIGTKSVRNPYFNPDKKDPTVPEFVGALRVRLYQWTAEPYVGHPVDDHDSGWPELNHQHLSIGVHADEGFWVVGGGAFANYDGAGSLLTSMYPGLEQDQVRAASHNEYYQPWRRTWNLGKGWHASAKDHVDPDAEYWLTGYCFAIQLGSVGGDLEPSPSIIQYVVGEDVIKDYDNSTVTAKAGLGSGYKLIGGGARAGFPADQGILLTESRPAPGEQAWQATAKDHHTKSEGQLTAWAISLDAARLEHDYGVRVLPLTKKTKGWPYNQHIDLPPLPKPKQGVLVSAGANAVRGGPGTPGVLLSAIRPLPSKPDLKNYVCHRWEARAKDHGAGEDDKGGHLEIYGIALVDV